MKVIKRGKTKNYSMFTMAQGNRQYKESHAVSLAKTIKENNMLEAFPVLCTQQDGKLVVIDGQHRIGACKVLKIEVPYVVVSGVTENDIALINGNQKQWLTKDYLNHFCELGYKQYEQLDLFVKKTGMPISIACGLLQGRDITEGGSTTNRDVFINGKFKIKNESEANAVCSIINSMKKTGCNFANNRSLVKAIQSIVSVVNDFSCERLVARMKYMDFKKRANWIDYCEQIEEFYNYRSPISCRVHIMSMLSDAGLLKK